MDREQLFLAVLAAIFPFISVFFDLRQHDWTRSLSSSFMPRFLMPPANSGTHGSVDIRRYATSLDKSLLASPEQYCYEDDTHPLVSLLHEVYDAWMPENPPLGAGIHFAIVFFACIMTILLCQFLWTHYYSSFASDITPTELSADLETLPPLLIPQADAEPATAKFNSSGLFSTASRDSVENWRVAVANVDPLPPPLPLAKDIVPDEVPVALNPSLVPHVTEEVTTDLPPMIFADPVALSPDLAITLPGSTQTLADDPTLGFVASVLCSLKALLSRDSLDALSNDNQALTREEEIAIVSSLLTSASGSNQAGNLAPGDIAEVLACPSLMTSSTIPQNAEAQPDDDTGPATVDNTGADSVAHSDHVRFSTGALPHTFIVGSSSQTRAAVSLAAQEGETCAVSSSSSLVSVALVSRTTSISDASESTDTAFSDETDASSQIDTQAQAQAQTLVEETEPITIPAEPSSQETESPAVLVNTPNSVPFYTISSGPRTDSAPPPLPELISPQVRDAAQDDLLDFVAEAYEPPPAFPMMHMDSGLSDYLDDDVDSWGWTLINICLNEDNRYVFPSATVHPAVIPTEDSCIMDDSIPRSFYEETFDLEIGAPDHRRAHSEPVLSGTLYVTRADVDPMPTLHEAEMRARYPDVALRFGIIQHDRSFRLYEPAEELRNAIRDERRAMLLASRPKLKKARSAPYMTRVGLDRRAFFAIFQQQPVPPIITYADALRVGAHIPPAITFVVRPEDVAAQSESSRVVVPKNFVSLNRNRGRLDENVNGDDQIARLPVRSRTRTQSGPQGNAWKAQGASPQDSSSLPAERSRTRARTRSGSFQSNAAHADAPRRRTSSAGLDPSSSNVNVNMNMRAPLNMPLAGAPLSWPPPPQQQQQHYQQQQGTARPMRRRESTPCSSRPPVLATIIGSPTVSPPAVCTSTMPSSPREAALSQSLGPQIRRLVIPVSFARIDDDDALDDA